MSKRFRHANEFTATGYQCRNEKGYGCDSRAEELNSLLRTIPFDVIDGEQKGEKGTAKRGQTHLSQIRRAQIRNVPTPPAAALLTWAWLFFLAGAVADSVVNIAERIVGSDTFHLVLYPMR